MASSSEDANKENTYRTRTRLPLQKGILQALPKHNMMVKNKKVRRPLMTINAQNPGITEAGPSKLVVGKSEDLSFNQDYTTEVFEYLLAKEIKPLQMPRTSSISSKEYNNISRACAINWLMYVNGADNPAIIHAACWYFDSVLGHAQLGKQQLVAAACFRIAEKLNGTFTPAMRLARYSNYSFTTDELHVVERSVMITLKFPSQPIVAQDYITYLSLWCACDSHNAGAIEAAATFLAMCGLMVDRVLCDEYPSVIAVAAVKNALLLIKKTELLPRLQMCNIFKVAEKKATNLSYTCLILRQAVRTVAAHRYEFKAPLENYRLSPCCNEQIIIRAANRLTVTDARMMRAIRLS